MEKQIPIEVLKTILKETARGLEERYQEVIKDKRIDEKYRDWKLRYIDAKRIGVQEVWNKLEDLNWF